MIHMLSGFSLKDGETLEEFRAAYAAFIDDLLRADVIVDAGPLGRRVSDTPMDTDEDNPREYFSVMSFRDRAHLDAAYAYIENRTQPSTRTHIMMHRRITQSVFTCWQDLD